MKNQEQVPKIIAALVTRAASIELRFISKNGVANSVGLYSDLIVGVEAPNSTTPPVSMRLGDMQELRFVEAAAYSNCTVIYWQVTVNSEDAIRAACEALEGEGCKTVVGIHHRPDQPETVCCLMQDPGGNLFGLIINPPYPFMRQPLGRYLAPLAALAAGIALLPILKALKRPPDGSAR